MANALGTDSSRPIAANRTMPDWRTAFAASMLAVIGVANAVLGVISLVSDVIELAPGSSGGLIVVGVATTALAVKVWRRSRAALTIGLTIFGLLLVAQVGDVAGGSSSADGAGLRVVVLALLVVSLATARFGDRGRSPRR